MSISEQVTALEQEVKMLREGRQTALDRLRDLEDALGVGDYDAPPAEESETYATAGDIITAQIGTLADVPGVGVFVKREYDRWTYGGKVRIDSDIASYCDVTLTRPTGYAPDDHRDAEVTDFHNPYATPELQQGDYDSASPGTEAVIPGLSKSYFKGTDGYWFYGDDNEGVDSEAMTGFGGVTLKYAA